jgi:MOSC domain-containing protein YiiM
MNHFRVKSVNISERKGEPKRPVDKILCQKDLGVYGDGHAGGGLRQVSLLAFEDIAAMAARGAPVNCGSFAENITTEGISVSVLPIGTRLSIGTAELEITQIGKECHNNCAIRQQIGDCVMPRQGVFAKVIKEGEIKRGDSGTYGV